MYKSQEGQCTNACYFLFQPQKEDEPSEPSVEKEKPRKPSTEKVESPKPSNIEKETTEIENEAEKEDTPSDIIPKKLMSNLFAEAKRLHNELIKSLGKQDTNGSPFSTTTGTNSDSRLVRKNPLKIRIK